MPVHYIDICPLKRAEIRAYGSMADVHDSQAMARFSQAILQRAVDYFGALGYAGDDEFAGPRVGYLNSRGDFDRLNLHLTQDIARLQEITPLDLNLEGALHLARLELQEIVPESEECLRLAHWVTRNWVRSTGRWRFSKNRYQSKGVRQHLSSTAEATAPETVKRWCRDMAETLYPRYRSHTAA